MSINLEPLVFDETSNPGFRFINLDGTVINVKSINLDNNGEIISIIDINNTEISSDDFRFDKELLLVPGIGYIPPNTVVEWKDKNYLLCFGWHTNVSNQTIYSWYLHELNKNKKDKCAEDKTLYSWMIDEINEVSFQ